jgi:hypothetical protein
VLPTIKSTLFYNFFHFAIILQWKCNFDRFIKKFYQKIFKFNISLLTYSKIYESTYKHCGGEGGSEGVREGVGRSGEK